MATDTETTEETRDEGGQNVGRIEEIQGVVIEAVFPDELPPINNAVTVARKDDEGKTVCNACGL